MSGKTFWIFLVLLLLVVFFLVPLMTPDEGYTEGDVGSDVDHDSWSSSKKVKKTARSVGGSRSYRSGK